MSLLRLQSSEGKLTTSREIQPIRRSVCVHGSCTFTEVARLVPSGGAIGRRCLPNGMIDNMNNTHDVNTIQSSIISNGTNNANDEVARLVPSGLPDHRAQDWRRWWRTYIHNIYIYIYIYIYYNYHYYIYISLSLYIYIYTRNHNENRPPGARLVALAARVFSPRKLKLVLSTCCHLFVKTRQHSM